MNLKGSPFCLMLWLCGGLFTFEPFVPPSLAQSTDTNAAAYTWTTFAGHASIGSDDGVGNNALFSFPYGIAVDTGGTLYVADTGNQTIRKITSAGLVTTIAGFPAFSGTADGVGSHARFSSPNGVAVNNEGILYVADTANCVIRKIVPVGSNWVVSTFVGQPGFCGTNDGTNGIAQFKNPRGVAVDDAGNVYVADSGNFTVRKITSNGVVSTIAGRPGVFGINDGVGTNAAFHYPTGLAVDCTGDLYVADQGASTIRKITATNWEVRTIAGLAENPGASNGPNANARFWMPTALAVDWHGTIFVADSVNNTIRQITPAGPDWVVSTLAGLGPNDYGTSDGTGTDARFYNPTGIAVDINDGLYVLDTFNNTIRTVTSAGVVNTLAGLADSAGDANGTGSNARFNGPEGVTVDDRGNLFVADTLNHTIRKITPLGVVTTLAGLATYSGWADGAGDNARFDQPTSLSLDTNGNIFVADIENHVIRKITSAGMVSTIAGKPRIPGTNDGPNDTARFNFPRGVAVAPSGTIYIADEGNYAIRKITALGTNWLVSTIVGGSSGTRDGTNAAAQFLLPFDLAVDTEDKIYVADYSRIREVCRLGPDWVVTTLPVIGSAYSVALDSAHNIYVAGAASSTVWKIARLNSNWVASTIGGFVDITGSVDGVGNQARFNSPFGIAVDVVGNVYLCDTHNNTIRKGVFSQYGPADQVPYNRPQTNGQLAVFLTPPEANGQWRFPWELLWHSSGQTNSGLVQDNYPVVFRDVPGYEPIPPVFTVPVTNGGTTFATSQYYRISNAGVTNLGSLTVNIGPGSPPGANWRFLGETDTDWRDPGASVSNLVPDIYFVEFRPVTHYVTPASQQAQVTAGETTVLSANYLLSASRPDGVDLPLTVPTNSISDVANFPYGFNGQLQCDLRKGSGAAVQQNVVLSAAHLVFDDYTLSFVSQAWWFLQREVGVFEPKPMAARGWLLLSGYAAQRTGERQSGVFGPDESTPQSRNLDVAALYFPLPVAGGGYGGYLPSDAVPNSWLTSMSPKMLVGYPVDGSLFGDASIVPGLMYQIGPQPYPLDLASDVVPNQQEVYAARWFFSYPGNSGGPLYVQLNGYYYPAAVYIGTLYSGAQPYASAVRAIDSDVAGIITLAAALGNTGTNSNGGVITVSTGQAGLGTSPYITVNLGPDLAITNGAGWRLQGDSSYVRLAKYNRQIVNGASSVTIQFTNIPGWDAPPQREVTVASNTTTLINATYLLPARLVVNPTGNFGSSNYTGGPFNPLVWTVSNAGQQDLIWSASKSADWLSLSTNNGTLAPGARTPVVITFNGNANNLLPGSYSDTIIFSNASSGLGSTSRLVNLSLSRPLRLSGVQIIAGNRIVMTLHGPAGKNFSIQLSTNLANPPLWTDILTLSNFSGPLIFTNPMPASSSKAFYRAREL